MKQRVNPTASSGGLAARESTRGILLVGNFFITAGSHQVCVGLADSLEAIGWEVVRTSFSRFRPFRLAGMVLSVFVYRNSYQVALVELFSGLSFLWPEETSSRCLS